MRVGVGYCAVRRARESGDGVTRACSEPPAPVETKGGVVVGSEKEPDPAPVKALPRRQRWVWRPASQGGRGRSTGARRVPLRMALSRTHRGEDQRLMTSSQETLFHKVKLAAH